MVVDPSLLDPTEKPELVPYQGINGRPWAHATPLVTADQAAPTEPRNEGIQPHSANTVRLFVALVGFVSARLNIGRWIGKPGSLVFRLERVVAVDQSNAMVDVPATSGQGIGAYLTHLNGTPGTAQVFFQPGNFDLLWPQGASKRLDEVEILDASAALATADTAAEARTARHDLYDYNTYSLIVDVTDVSGGGQIFVQARSSGLVNPLIATPGHWSPNDMADNITVTTGESDGHPYRFDIDTGDGVGRYALHFNAWQPWVSALVWSDDAANKARVYLTARR